MTLREKAAGKEKREGGLPGLLPPCVHESSLADAQACNKAGR